MSRRSNAQQRCQLGVLLGGGCEAQLLPLGHFARGHAQLVGDVPLGKQTVLPGGNRCRGFCKLLDLRAFLSLFALIAQDLSPQNHEFLLRVAPFWDGYEPAMILNFRASLFIGVLFGRG